MSHTCETPPKQKQNKKKQKRADPTLSPTIGPSPSPSHSPVISPTTALTDAPSAFPTQFPANASSIAPYYAPSYSHETSLSTSLSDTLFAILAAVGIAILLACVGGAFYLFRRRKARNRRIVGKNVTPTPQTTIVQTGQTPARNDPTLPSSFSGKMGEKRPSYRTLERTFAKLTPGRKGSIEVSGDPSTSPSPKGSTPTISHVDDAFWMGETSSGSSGEEEPGRRGSGHEMMTVGANVEMQLSSALEAPAHEINRGPSMPGSIPPFMSVKSSSDERGISIISYDHKEGEPPTLIKFVEDLPDLPRGETSHSSENNIAAAAGNIPGERE